MARKPTPPFIQPSTSELLSQGFRLNAPIEEAPAEVKAPTTRTWGEAATDTGRAILGGVGGLISGAGTLAGMLPGGNMDNATVQFGDSTQKYWEDGKSAALKQKKEDRSKAIDKTDGQWGKAGTAFLQTVSDPALLLDTVASNVTTLIPGTVAGRLGAAAKMARGMRVGPLSVAGSEALASAAGTLGTRISIGTGAVQQGADVSGELYKSAMKKTNDEWMQNPEFMAQLAQTDGSDQAIHDLKSQYAQSASRAAFLPAAGVSVFANKFMPGGDMVERALVGGAARNTIAAGTKYAIPKAMAKSSLGEAAQEFVEEGGGKRVANAAMQSYVDPSQDSWEGVGENAGMGAAGGFGLGMAGGAFHRQQDSGQSTNTAAAQQAAAQAAQQAAAQQAAQQAAAAALAAAQAAAQQPGAVASRAAVAGNAAQIGYTPPTHTVFANGTIVPASNTTPGEQAVFDQRFTPQPTGDITDVEDVSQARATTAAPEAPIAAPAAQPIEQVAAPVPEAPLTRAPDIATGPARVLQNRDRSTAASIGQMNDIASAPDYLRAGQARVMDSGAPVVFGAAPTSALMGKQQQIADGHGARVPVQYAVVEAADVLPSHQADGMPIAQYQQGVPGQLRAVAGNGRAAGITEAYRRGTTAQYRQDLIDDALDLGVDPEAISAMSAPMLVRVMPEEHVTDDIGDRSNISGTAALSATEQAANDTKRLDLSALSFDEVGMPDRQSIAQFVNAMPVGERGAMMQPDGSPTRQLVDRITSAAFKSAYGNDELVALQAQSTDPEVRNIITALASVAGPMAGLDGAGDLDIRGAVSEAAQMAVNAKRLGVPLADYLNNADMGFSGEAFVVAKFMADNIRSAKRMAEGLRAWVNYVAEQVAIARDNQSQDGFFGATPTASRNDVFSQLGATNDQANTSSTPLQNGASGPSRVTSSPQRQEAQPVTEPSRPADFEENNAQEVAPEVEASKQPLDQAENKPEKQGEASNGESQADASEVKANLDERNGKDVRGKAKGMGIELKDADGRFKVLPVLVAEIKAAEEAAAAPVKPEPIKSEATKPVESPLSVMQQYEAGGAVDGMDAVLAELESQPALPPKLSALLQEAHKAHGHDVKRSVVARAIAREKKITDGTPKAKQERTERIARLEADLALFDQAAKPEPNASDDQLKALINSAYVKALNGKPFSDGLVKTSEKLYRALIDQDAKSLADILNPSNKISRSAFEIILPQVKLANSISGVKEFTDDFIGNIKNANQIAVKPYPVKSEPKPTASQPSDEPSGLLSGDWRLAAFHSSSEIPTIPGIYRMREGTFARFDHGIWWRTQLTPKKAMLTEFAAADQMTPKNRHSHELGWVLHAEISKRDPFGEASAMKVVWDKSSTTKKVEIGEPADAFLQAPTPEEVVAQQDQAEAAAKAETAQRRAQDERDRLEHERKDIAKASEAAADTFELGGDAEQNLSGQGDVFGEAPTTPEAAKPQADTKRTNPTPITIPASEFVAGNLSDYRGSAHEPKDHNYVNVDESTTKDVSGFASENSAIIAWKQIGKPVGAVLVPFRFSDGSYSGKYADAKTRYSLFIPRTKAAPQEQQKPAPKPVEASPKPSTEAAEKPQVKANTIFTEDAAAAARARLKAKLGRLNSGIDPEMLMDGITLAGYHIEQGARTFTAYAKAMIEDLGDGVKPYLKSWYMAISFDPRASSFSADMTPVGEVATLDLAELNEPSSGQTLSQNLVAAIESGNMPKDNPALKKLVEAFDGKPADQSRMKQAQEQLEMAIVMTARKVVAKNEGDQSTYDALLRLYESQPNLNIRTSTSIANQAYSTPAPLAYLASKLTGITRDTRVLEPTGGTGMLLIAANPSKAVVNELNDLRVSLLEEQGFNPTQKDAATESLASKGGLVDAVITNPPFGSAKDANGKPVKIKVDGYDVGQIDHLIAARALETMKDDGKATLIIGANKVAGGMSTDDRIFFNWLYSHYNVDGHFEVNGDLYTRQGAGWPVRVISISGRQKSSKFSPLAGTIQRANNWEQVYEQYNTILDSRGKSNAGTSASSGSPSVSKAESIDLRNETGGQAPAVNRPRPAGGGDGNGNVTRAPAGVVSDSPKPAVAVMGTKPSEQRRDERTPESSGLDSAGVAAKPAGAKPTGVAGTASVDGTNEFQATYIPRSARKDEGVLIPANMAQPTQDALDRLEDEVGNIDEFARIELGYKSVADMHAALMGLQVDSVAMSIWQIKRGKAVVIADQTGIGKGRQAASIIRWSVKQGMTPVFISVKPSLFTDMYGDLADIGTNDVNPFILNGDAWVSGEDGTKLFSNKPATHKSNLQRIASSGELPSGSNALFMTYSQINTDNIQRQVLTSLAPNAVFILDESHNAAGASATGEFMISALTASRGVTYLSATYAKRPDNMPLYFKTDIGDAAADAEGLSAAMSAGGLPLQTVVSNNLVKAGQMFRRERSYDGISIVSSFDTPNRALHERMSNEATKALRAIVSADRMFHAIFVKDLSKELQKEGASIKDGAGNQASAGVQHTEFSSVVHNFVKQMLLGLKAQTAADEAIASLKRGEKPIIAVENTMGSFLNEYAASNGITQGESLGSFDYRTVLSRALARTRVIIEKSATGDETKRPVSLSELDIETAAAYRSAQEVIDGLSLSIPVSPIDWIRAEVARAGFSIAEITGRNLAVDYSEPSKPVLSAIDSSEQTDKVGTTRLFNGGKLDALVLNVAGSTGISLHSSERFEDQRQRHMIVAQAAGDINIFMQMLGRVHRTGQVNLPKYTILSVDLPTEKRPTAVLSVKMKSLNANTSSNTESATSVKTADILNKYGDQIVAQYLMDNLQLARDLDVVDLITGDGVTEDIARKATGRLALQPIEVQHTFYDEVEAQYIELIEYLDKTNQNDLVPRTFDFDAKELRQEVLFDGPNKSTPFGEDAIYGEYSVKAQGEPMKPGEIQGAMNGNLGGLSPEAHIEKMLSIADKQFALHQGKLTDEKQRESALAVSTLGRQFMVSHPVGSVFRVDINSDQFNAVVLNVRSTHKETGNPFSLSKIQLTVAVNGSLRSLTIPATQFKKIEISSIAPSYKIEQLFKEQPPNQRETAKIVTGNLLAAYGEIEGTRGTIISFTKQDGTSEQGILLPKAFDYSKNTRGDYRLQSGAEALKFLQNSLHKDIGRFGIMSRDGIIRVLPNWKGVSIRVPKSKLKGGKVFLDAGLIAAGGDFVSYGGQMAQNVDNSSDAVKVLDLLMKKQALYALPSMAEEAKGMAETTPSSTPKFSRSLPDVSDPRTGISTALLELGQDANLFQYPRSDALYLEHIAEDKSVIGDDGKPRTIEVLPVDRSTDDAAQWMLANTTPKDDDATDTRSWMLKTPTGKWATLTKTKGTVYINVSGVGEGNGGSAIYDLAANFALNNGLVFVGDPSGVSPAAMRRRLENMLSSAIKYGTTDHLQPHPDQYLGDASIGVPELDWKKGDTLGNIRSMIDVSIGANAHTNPFATALIHYDPATQSFTDGNQRLDDEGLSEMLGLDGRKKGTGQAGDTTLRRNALFQSLLQSVGNRTRFVAQIHHEQSRGGTGVGSALEKTFYSRGSAPGKLGVALVQASANSLTQHWANAPEAVVLSSMDDARVPQAVRDEDARQRSQGATGSPEGFVHEGVVYLVADQLPTAADVKRVLMHEALGHVGLRGVFGNGLNQVLNQVAMGRRADVSAKAAQYGLDMNDPAQRLDAAEEMLAEMAQANPQLGFVKRAVSAIRNWLRTHGFSRLKLTDADIVQAYILPARGWVERGSNAGSNGSSLFSRGIQSLRDISGWTDLPDFQSNNESTVLFNGGNGPYIDVVKDNSRGLWPGLFSSENVESAHGPGMGDIITAFRVSNDKMLENFDGIDEELVKNELMQLLPNRVKKQVLDNEDALETLITAVVEDNHDRVSDEFNEIFGLDDAEGSWEAQSLRGQLATRLGYDAVAMDDEHGTSWYIRPGIKSIPLPNKSGSSPAFSRSTIVGETTRQHTPEQLRAMANVGFQVEVPTLQERAKALWADAGKKLTQGIVDQFSPVKELSQDAYRLLRMSKGASGAFEALMHGGRLKLTDGVYDIDRAQRGGVVEKLFKPMQGEHHDFLRWVAANRAERLLGDGREHLFTQADIDALKTLADGTLNHAYTLKNGPRAGQTTTGRRDMYQDSLVTFNEFNTNALDMAEQSGLINADGRKDWESEFYVPFYRAMQEDGSGVVGGNIKSGVVRQSAFKHLKGGTDKLNADLLDNTLMNWAHLLDAGAKNRAALATLEAAQNMGVAIEASADVARDIGKATHNRNGVVWAMDEGVQRYFVVDDPYILTALTSLEYAGMKNPVMNAMGTMKRVLTIGVTASPFFKIRNLIRDSVQAIGLGDMPYNIASNLKEGWKLTDPKSDAYFSLLASGGTIHFGSMYEGNESKRIQALVESGVDRDTILNDPYRVKEFYRKTLEPLVTAYNEVGNRGEAINRAALYDHLVKKGVSHAEAALQARDLMDFSMQGAFTSVRFLTQVVPFMNARLQGLYKLGKSAKENPQRFTTVLAAVAAVSLALLAAYGDDDDWKRRDESDRNNFWWFKVGGKAYRIPKPFEIGAIATLAERGFELAFDKEMTGKRFRGQVLTLLGDNLSMNPVPQLVKPMLDVYANLDSFTGRPIESMGMERLKAEYRYDNRTSMVARGASTAMNAATGLLGKEALSPVQIDHMLRGYFGWLGSFVVGTADLLARPATGQVDQASRDLWKTATGNIASDLRDAPSRYVSQMYEQAKEIERAYGTWRELQKTGKTQEAQEFRADHLDELRQFHRIEAIKKRASQLNQQARIVERSATMAPEQKRERLRLLSDQRNALAKSLV